MTTHNERRSERVFPEAVGETAQQLLAGVVLGGTGRGAQIGEFAAGKTGTTENYGDAWFVGFNEQLTVAVWVGYPDGCSYMETEYRGGPVAGGTFPTEIWHDFMRSWIGIRERRDAAQRQGRRRLADARPRHPRSRRRARTPRRPSPSGSPTRPSRAPPSSREPASPRRSASRRRPPPRRRSPPRPHAPAAAVRRRQQGGGAAPGYGPPSQAARRRVRRMAGGRGRETQRLDASQKRHGSSTARVMPMRCRPPRRGGWPRRGGRISIGAVQGAPVRGRARCPAPG